MAARVLFVVAFLDMLGVSMILPALPQYVQSMDARALVFGLLLSVYGCLQFVAAPLVGSLSDRYGRKRVLLSCLAGTSLSYLLLALSWNVYVVFVSRVPAALFKHTLDVIKVAVTDGAPAERRAVAIGRLHAAINAGFIVGPTVGGYVSSVPNGFNYATLLTTALFGVNFCLVARFYVEQESCDAVVSTGSAAAMLQCQETDERDRWVDWRHVLHNAWTKVAGMRDIVKASKSAQTLLTARLLLTMAAVLYRTHFSVLLEDKFGMDAKDRGLMLSYMGLLGVVGSFSVGVVTKLVKSNMLVLQLAVVTYAMTFFVLSGATAISTVYLTLVPQVISIR